MATDFSNFTPTITPSTSGGTDFSNFISNKPTSSYIGPYSSKVYEALNSIPKPSTEKLTGFGPDYNFPQTKTGNANVDKALAKVPPPTKPGFFADQNLGGIIKNTITGIPNAFMGGLLDYLKTPEGEQAAANLSWSDIGKSIVPALAQIPGQVISDITGKDINLKSNLPNIAGDIHIQSIQNATRTAVESGENPYFSILKAVPQAIFDGLMIAGVADKVFSPRQEVIATGVKTNDLPSDTKIAQGDKSFRLTKPVQSVSSPVPNEAIDLLQKQGVPFKNFNPTLRTYFRQTPMANGVLKGEFVQIKPSFFNEFIDKFKGDIHAVPESETNVVAEKTSSLKQIIQNIKDIPGQEGGYVKNPLVNTEKEPISKEQQVQDLANQIKAKSVEPISSTGENGIVKTPNLRTFDFNELEGKPQTPEENAKIHDMMINHPEEPMTPGGESFKEAVDRGISTVKQILNTPGNKGITTHNSMYGLIKLWDEKGRPDTLDKAFREEYTTQEYKNPTGSHYVLKGEQGDIYLLRHGETTDNTKKVFRTPGAQLTEKGRQQAVKLANELKDKGITKIYSSDLPRAIETSKIVMSGGKGLDINNNNLDNRKYGKPTGIVYRSQQNRQGGGGEFRGSGISGSIHDDLSLRGQRILSEKYERNGGATQTSNQRAQAKQILAEKTVVINEDTPIVLKAMGFSDSFIKELKNANTEKGLKNILLDSKKLKEENVTGAFSSETNTLHINSNEIDTSSVIDGSIINHEIDGHKYYSNLSNQGRKTFFNNLKGNKNTIKQAWEKSKDTVHSFYWNKTVNEIGWVVQESSNPKIAREILDRLGLIEIKSDDDMSLDNFIDRSLNLDKTISLINKELNGRGLKPIEIKAENTDVIKEHVAMIAENARKLTTTGTSVINKYIADIKAGKLKFGENGVHGLAEGPPSEMQSLLSEAKKYKSAEEFVKAQGDSFYHTTPAQFDKFDKKFLAENTNFDNAQHGFFFTDNLAQIDEFKNVLKKGFGGGFATDGRTKTLAELAKYRTIEKIAKKEDFFNFNYKAKDLTAKEARDFTEFADKKMGGLYNQEGDIVNHKKMTDSQLNKFLKNEVFVEDLDPDSSFLPVFTENHLADFIKYLEDKGYNGMVSYFAPGKNEYMIFDPNKFQTKSQLTDIWNKAQEETSAFRISKQEDNQKNIKTYYNKIDPNKKMDEKFPKGLSPAETLKFAEERVGVKAAEIGIIKGRINREELSLEAAKENPALFKRVYGENRIAEHETKLSDLRQKLMDLNKQVAEINTEIQPTELDKVLEQYKPMNMAPKIRVSGKDIQIPETLTNRQVGIEVKKEALENSPYKEFEKYVAKIGSFKGELPEVTGQSIVELRQSKTYGDLFFKDGRVKNKNAQLIIDFIQKGDQIIDNAFGDYRSIPTSEEVRANMPDYLKQKQDIKEETRQLSKDIKSFIQTERDRIALTKISQEGVKLDEKQAKLEEKADKKKQQETLADWKNFIKTYTAEQSLPQSLDEIIPPKIRGGIQAPKLDLAKAKDKGWDARESLDRNIEKAFTREDAIELNKFLSDHLRENATKEKEFIDNKLQPLEDKMNELGIRNGSDESYFISIYGEGKISLEDLKKEFPKTWSKIQQAIPTYRRIYDVSIDELNAERKKFGKNPVPKLPNYFPHMDDISFWTKYYGFLDKNDDLPTSIAGLTKDFKPHKVFFRHELHRSGQENEINAIEGAKIYIKALAKQMFSLDNLARADALSVYIRISDKVGQRLGTPLKLGRFVGTLQEIRQNQLGGKMGSIDREIEKFGDRKVINTVLTLSKLIGKNIIAFNPAAVLGHGVSITVNAATVDKIPFIKGLMLTASTPFSKDPYWMIDGQRSDLLYRRTPKELMKTRFESVEAAGGWMIKQMDIFKTKLAISSKYFELIGKGVSPEIAIKEADKYGGRIVGDYSRGLKPIILNQKLVKVIAQFQFGMNDALSVIMHDIPYQSKKTTGGPDGEKVIKMKLGKDGIFRAKNDYIKMFWKYAQWMVYAYLLNILYKKIKGSGKGLSPLDIIFTLTGAVPTYGLTYPFVGFDTSGQSTSFLGRLGLGATELAGELPFVNTFFGNTPTATFLSNTITDAVSGNLLKSGIDVAAGVVSPVGGGGETKKLIEGELNYEQGYVANKSGIPEYLMPQGIWAHLQALAFGKSASSAAQAYYNSFNQTSPGKAVYDEITQLIKEGKIDEANAIYNAMTPKEQGTFKAAKTRAGEIALVPTAAKIMLLAKAGKVDEANAVYDALTVQQKGYFKGARALMDKAINVSAVGAESHGTYVGNQTGPDANIILGGNPDDGVIAGYNPNHEPIYLRDSPLEASRRQQMYDADPYWKNNGIQLTQLQYDHIVPLEAGGTNTANNGRLILRTVDESNTAEENALGKAYKAGAISRRKAAEESITYKKNQ